MLILHVEPCSFKSAMVLVTLATFAPLPWPMGN